MPIAGGINDCSLSRRGKENAKVVPLPRSLRIAIRPPSASQRSSTADIPTPRPEMSDTVSAVLTPALRHESGHGPLRGEALPGLLVTVDDPARAQSLFAAWGVLRPVDVHDVAACVSDPEHPDLIVLRY